MFRQCLILTLLAFAVEGQTAIKDDFQDTQMSMMTVIQRALLEENSITAVVATGVTVAPARQDEILGSAIAVTPGSVGDIVETALRNGVKSQVVANQCQRALTHTQISTLVGTAIREGANPDRIMSACLPAVPTEAAAELVAAALQNVDPLLVDDVLLASLDALDRPGVSAERLVADGMVKSGMMIGSAAINEPLALNMLDALEVDELQIVTRQGCSGAYRGAGSGTGNIGSGNACVVSTSEDAVLVENQQSAN